MCIGLRGSVEHQINSSHFTTLFIEFAGEL